MIQIHFYTLGECRKREYIKDWVNWTGEIPQNGDIVLIHFVDESEHEYKYRVIGRVIDGKKPNDIAIIVSLIKPEYA